MVYVGCVLHGRDAGWNRAGVKLRYKREGRRVDSIITTVGRACCLIELSKVSSKETSIRSERGDRAATDDVGVAASRVFRRALVSFYWSRVHASRFRSVTCTCLDGYDYVFFHTMKVVVQHESL